jgi:hypothetical protein
VYCTCIRLRPRFQIIVPKSPRLVHICVFIARETLHPALNCSLAI